MIQLVPANTNDIQTIYSLAYDIWQIHYVPIIGQDQVNYMLDKMYDKESLTEQMMIKKHQFYLIQHEKKHIGFVSISGEKEVWIHKFYIQQDYQGKGLGEKVFEQIRQLRGASNTYTLTVNRQNFKSINFYFKLGFKIDHIADFDIGNGFWMNDFIMKCNISNEIVSHSC